MADVSEPKEQNAAAASAATSTVQNRERISPWRLFLRAWRMNVTSTIDQPEVIDELREDSYISGRYVLMTTMSAGIAILGLLLSSPAVVIGAMLLSPLMGPIMGAGMSLAIGDYYWLRRSARALGIGTVLAILFCAFIVLMSPLQTVTPEIAARTRPNLFDLAVALFSAIAGAYAMIRGRGGAIVGVAIATALMPPLAVVGFGLATFNWTVFGGSLLLFVTNLITIALTMALMARIYGFHTSLSDRQSLYQNVVILVSFVVLAVPLAYSLNRIAWEASSTRVANGYIKDLFGDRARVSAIEFDFGASPITVNATVLTPDFIAGAEARSTKALTEKFGRDVSVSIEQYRVGTGKGEADAAQLAAARAREQALSTEREIAQLAERMALVAGVPSENITLDAKRRRAVVKAAVLPGATIRTYRVLEGRVAALNPEWQLRIEPPALPLPAVALDGDKVSTDATQAFADIVWAAQRIEAPLGINGPSEAVSAMVEQLAGQDIRSVRAASIPSRAGYLTFEWLAPDAVTE